MPTTEQFFTSQIADLAAEQGISPDHILIRDALDLKAAPARAPAGSKFINAGWQHRGTKAGDLFWRAF